jgi:DNA-binding transcriptional ArsR family regulator
VDDSEPYPTRVHFTEDDVVRIRFSRVPAPLVETVLGLAELRGGGQRAGVALSQWSSQARRAFPATARPLLDLIPVRGYWPEFLDPVVADLDEGLDIVSATPRQELRTQLAAVWRHAAQPPSWVRALAEGDVEALKTLQRALRDFYTACVAPHWAMIVGTFRKDVAERISVLAATGLAGVFGTLHEDLAWYHHSLKRSSRSLERAGTAGEFWLDGQGVQLLPSALWSGPPLFSLGPPESGGSTVIYPARPAGTSDSAAGSRDLAKLLGGTRAAVLRALRDPCGTAELATRLGISAPSVSEHTAALRGADLIETARCGRAVRHSLTPLGRSLLNGR